MSEDDDHQTDNPAGRQRRQQRQQGRHTPWRVVRSSTSSSGWGVSAFIAVAATTVITACRLLFGVSDLGEGPTTTTTTDAGPTTDSSVNGPDCDASGGGSRLLRDFCACEKHDFCDDFETAGNDDAAPSLGRRWSGISGSENPARQGNVTMALTTMAYQGSNAILSTASEPKSSSYALLMHQTSQKTSRPGLAFGGIRYRSYVKIDDLQFAENRGPVSDAGSAVMGALARIDTTAFPPRIVGVATLASTEGIFLFSSADLLEPKARDASADDVLVKISQARIEDLKAWISMDLVIAYRSVAKRVGGLGSCENGADTDLVIAARIGDFAQGCALLPASVGGVGFAEMPTVAAGAALYGGGAIAIRHDAVTVDFLDP